METSKERIERMEDNFAIEAEAIRETQKEILVEVDDEQIWVPKGQIRPGSTVTKKGDIGTLMVSQWLAKAKGWM